MKKNEETIHPFNIYRGKTKEDESVEGVLTKGFSLNENSKGVLKYYIISLENHSLRKEVLTSTIRRFTGNHDKRGNRLYDGQRVKIHQNDHSLQGVIRWNHKKLKYGVFPANNKHNEKTDREGFFSFHDIDEKNTLGLSAKETPRDKTLPDVDLISAVPAYDENGLKILKEGMREPRKEKESVIVPNRKTPILTKKSYKKILEDKGGKIQRLFPANSIEKGLFLGDIVQFNLRGIPDYKIAEVIGVKGGFALKSPDGQIREFGNLHEIYVIGHVEINPKYLEKDLEIDLTGESITEKHNFVFTTRGKEKEPNTFFDYTKDRYVSPYFQIPAQNSSEIHWPETFKEEQNKIIITEQ